MKLLCGQCGNMVEVDDNDAGTMAFCSQCKHSIPIPLVHPDRIDHMGPEQLEKHLNSEDILNNPFVDPPPEDFVDKARRVMARKMEVLCPSCRARMSVGVRCAGQIIRCIACGRDVLVPINRKLDELESQVVRQTAETEARIRSMSDEEYARFQAGIIPPQAEEFPTPVGKRRIWIIVAIAIAAVVIGVACFFAFRGDSKTDAASPNGAGNSAQEGK